jgi:hypothetical protein
VACNISVVVRNNGPGPFQPPSRQDVMVTLLEGATFLGNTNLLRDSSDEQVLRNPGGELGSPLHINVGKELSAGAHTLTARLVIADSVGDRNRQNNEIVQTVTCGATSPAQQSLLPDLQPTQVRLGDACKILVTLRNNGPGTLTDTDYAAIVELARDGAPFGGGRLDGFDFRRTLVSPGSQVEFEWFRSASLQLPAGQNLLRVRVRSLRPDANPQNDELSRTVTCVR